MSKEKSLFSIQLKLCFFSSHLFYWFKVLCSGKNWIETKKCYYCFADFYFPFLSLNFSIFIFFLSVLVVIAVVVYVSRNGFFDVIYCCLAIFKLVWIERAISSGIAGAVGKWAPDGWKPFSSATQSTR